MWAKNPSSVQSSPAHPNSYVREISRQLPLGLGMSAMMRPLSHSTRSAGYHVFATARNPDILVELAREGLTAVPLDVTSAASIADCRKRVNALLEQPRLDILINNA